MGCLSRPQGVQMIAYIVMKQGYKVRGEVVGVYTSKATAMAVREAVWQTSAKMQTKGLDCWIETKTMDL
jgi:hypothetical protein